MILQLGGRVVGWHPIIVKKCNMLWNVTHSLGPLWIAWNCL